MKSLKNVMLINALSSGATGLLLVLFSRHIAQLFGVAGQTPFVAVGIFLLLFSAVVFLNSRRNPFSTSWLKLIVAVDILWVIESLILVVPKMFNFSPAGYILILAVAVWVAAMAYLQAKGLRQVSRA